MTVRTRFAPSPTGYLHIGGARTALYCWLESRRRGGSFVLRIEDTDRERSTQEAVQAILDGMSWLGLAHDEGPFYQTLRMDRYREVAEQLLREGKAYYAYESKEEIEAFKSGSTQPASSQFFAIVEVLEQMVQDIISNPDTPTEEVAKKWQAELDAASQGN